MKIACLLPTSGEPLLARYWCRNYEQVWKDEVDELHVLLNGYTDEAANIYAAAGGIVTVTGRMGHGQALDILVRDSDADAVVFMEDDAFVRKPGVIMDRLWRVANGEDDVIGTPRGGMDPAIGAAAQEKWGTIEGPDGSSGHGIWPAFFFARPKDLQAVQRLICESFTWRAGETIPGLGYTCPSEMCTDTMTAMAFQLRDKFRITPDVQYKELWQKECKGDEPWFHAGGLANDPASGRPDIGMDNLEGVDWAHRIWWWRRAGLDYSKDAARMKVDPDYWNGKLEPWITWDDKSSAATDGR